ncbi:MAG: hypothetical protein JEY99_13350 [Spirochaetales bacterium]|nr:hypothetical protein [Spirochaetales bacterium]
MEIIGLKNIKKKDIPLHYRNEYSGDFTFKDFTGKEEYVSAEFILERNALGQVNIDIEVKNDLDYPLLSTISKLKTYIINLDKDGNLP